MVLEGEDEVRGHLPGTVEGGLAAAERGVERRARGGEVGGLCGGDGGDFAPAAGVGRGRLEGEEVGGWGGVGEGGGGMGEVEGDEVGLERGG